jgi:5-methylcytosine-specific restriction endonuclease McrA
MRQYREENREAVLAAQRRYYREHVEERKVYDRAYREANRDRRNKWHREWSQRNPERIAFYNSRYQKSEVGRENGRKRTREWRRRNLDRVREDRRAAYQSDPERHREYTRRWREANIEHANALARAWYRENKAKVKAWDHARRVATNTGEFFTAEDIEIIYSEQDGHCTYCRTDLSSGYEADHFIPIARGGGNEPENIVLACMPCNRSKGAKMPWEWRPDEFRTPPRP